jgi:hypothetical protein
MGYVILDPAHPDKVLSRSEQPFLIPPFATKKPANMQLELLC